MKGGDQCRAVPRTWEVRPRFVRASDLLRLPRKREDCIAPVTGSVYWPVPVEQNDLPVTAAARRMRPLSLRETRSMRMLVYVVVTALMRRIKSVQLGAISPKI